jgi:hypothetical protein
MLDKQISRRNALVNTLVVGGGLLGVAAVSNAQVCSSQQAVLVVDKFSDLACLSANQGQIAITKGHTISGIGSLAFILKAGVAIPDGGTKINSVIGNTFWEDISTENLTLYHFGGTFEGNCVAAMDAFLASTIEQIKVPDRVTLGSHIFSANKKIINGGNGVKFVGVSAGFRPRNIEYFELNGFTNIVMSLAPSDGHQFFAPASNAVHGVVRLVGNSGGGGIGGIIASYENSRSIRQIFILDNDFNDQVGEVGGTGYGIQYANENAGGECWIERNKIKRAGRHSYYIARNAGGRVNFNNNIAIDHRQNSLETRHNFRPAIEIVRSQNVYGFGNEVNGFYDGAVDIGDEPIAEQSSNPIQAHGIQLFATKLKNPKNGLAAIRLGGQVPANNGLNSVKLIGIDFESDGVICPVISFNYGHDLYAGHISARYKNISSGAIRAIVLNGNTTSDSTNHIVDHVHVQATNCVGASLDIFRVQNGAAISQIPIKIQGVTVKSDAATATFSSEVAIDNRMIELMPGVNDDGLVFNSGKYLARTLFKSAGFNGRISAASILTPVGVFTPLFFGEELYLSNSVAKSFWKANGLTKMDWVKLGS